MNARVSVCLSSVVCLVCVSAVAAVSYTYENDSRTLVATVTGNDTDLTTSDEDQTWFTENVTNFVKRGSAALKVWEGVADSFSGDIRIEEGYLSFYANSLGVNGGQGKIQISKGGLVHIGTKHLTVARDVEFCLADAEDSDWGGRSIEVWKGRAATVSGKVSVGNRNAFVTVYEGGTLAFTGGVEDTPDISDCGYFYVGAFNGSTVTFAEKPLKLANGFYFDVSGYVTENPDKYRGADGYVGHYVFSVQGNEFSSLGFGNRTSNARLMLHDVKTTVDWAFNKSDMTVYWGNDARWDLCGTRQQVGQFDVNFDSGNAPVVTNSFEEPAVLRLAMMYGPNNTAADIRIGGNLSAEFVGDIYTTKIDHAMTARGCLTVEGDGVFGKSTLEFTENGSWPNATNVTVNGCGKIVIANPYAFGRKAAVNLKSDSSLEIAEGVTVNVKFLTVGGVEKRPGLYTFGAGTLAVSGPRGIRIILK